MSTKTPCGMRDFDTYDIMLRKHIIDTIEDVCIRYNSQRIDTPIAEVRKTINDLYGEEFNKLVYELESKNEDDETEKLLLRYDLTVPFARYIADHGIVKGRFYRYGKVYRKDQPQISKGRFREFVQFDCDFIGGNIDTQVYNDMDILCLVDTVLKELKIGNFCILFNHRFIIDQILEICKVPDSKKDTVMSSLDKLDKHEVSYVIKELEDKGLDNESIQMIKEIVNELKDSDDVFSVLKSRFITNEANAFIDIFRKFLNDMQALCKTIVFDPLLVRGMGYYTGIIYEAKTKNMSSSIAGGGRYDSMLGKLSSKGDIPAIGVSFGIERIAVLKKQLKYQVKFPTKHFFIASIGKNMQAHKVKLAYILRSMGFVVDYFTTSNPKMKQQMEYTMDNNIPYMIILGNHEVENNNIKIKKMEEDADKSVQTIISMDELEHLNVLFK
jgi:histidyl-tRNA synthetase